VPKLEFDGVSGMLPWSDSFNGNGFTLGKLLWMPAMMLISDGAASSLGEEVICLLSLEWPLRWCQRQVASVGFLLRGFLVGIVILLFGCGSFLQKLGFSIFSVQSGWCIRGL
jgi:hypothetical protein